MSKNRLWDKGDKYKNDGDFEKAILTYDKVLKKEPDHYIILYNKGECLIELCRYEEAVDCFKASQQIDPGDDSCALDLGKTLFELGRLKEAREVFRRVANSKPLLYGADVKARDWLDKIDTAEGIAIKKLDIDPEVEQAMKSIYADPRVATIDGALCSAADHTGNIEAAKIFLKHGANPNYKRSGWTPLLLAAENGHADIVKLLLEKGADPNDQNVFAAHTPLILAALNDHEEVVKTLIEAGSDVNRKNQWGRTALKAAHSDNIRELLIKAGAKE